MISSALSCATTLGHRATKKSPATSVLHIGVKRRIAGPVHFPTSLWATASKLQKVRSQMSRVDTLGVPDVAVNALAAPAAAIPPILSP